MIVLPLRTLLRAGFLFSVLAFTSLMNSQASANSATNLKAIDSPKVTIIIDDVGNNESRGLRTVNLHGPVTLAILPERPFSAELANKAHAIGKEIILHAPMENLRDAPLGGGALTSDMSSRRFKSQLLKNIESIPHLMGINNHMGSLLTTKHLQMNWTMKILKDKNLMFVDSRTNPKSIAKEVAMLYNIPTVSRDIFLDHERKTDYIAKQFEKCLALAVKNGNCLMIGHPYPETLAHLEKALPLLVKRGFQQQPLSRLIEQETLARNPPRQPSIDNVTPRQLEVSFKDL
ncbi:divergent polysaccharide deacetylase family protein [Litoribacillus peritrichatus]|uniref:Divergent polysaccharide deacetylase family protein n=1 Tax=Litoribacillus peritrichatus TaxID=718191 RepID=A0ABP7MSA9_9GAMM